MATTVTDQNTAKDDRRRARMGSLAVVLTKTDRILTNRDDVTFAFYEGDSPSVDAPAWNDGKRITIHANRLPSIESASGLVTTLGLNHHEVAHVLFSLGTHTPFIQEIARKGHFDAYNLLEDMRIETLLSSQYVSMKKYLTAPVLHFIVDNEDAWPTAHLLTYGRRFLPLEIRKEFRKRFIGSASLRRDAESIIDEFRMMDLSTPSKHMRAGELVAEFHALLESLNPSLSADQQEALNGHKGCKGVANFTNDRAKVARAEKDAGRRQNAATSKDEGDDENDWDDEDDDTADWWDGDDGNMGDDSDDDDSSDSPQSGRGRGKNPKDGDDAGDSGSGGSGEDQDDDTDAPGSAGRGNGSPDGGDDGDQAGDGLDVDGEPGSLGAPGGASSAAVENLMNNILAALQDDPEVQQELTRLQSAMADNNNMEVSLQDDKVREKAPSAEAGSACASVIREFQVLNTPFEAGWEYGTDYGRINVQRAMAAEFGDTDIYDSWDEGREADAALEAVILLDKSSSMSGDMGSASEAAWVIKRGLDEVDAKSVVITFGDSTERLYARGERANPSKVKHPSELQGATYPDRGLEEARVILNNSDRPNRLIVVVTDGGFSSGRRVYDQMTGNTSWPSIDYKGLLDSINATRVYVGIRTESSPSLRPSYDVHARISDPKEIPAIVRQSVASMLQDAYKRR